MMRKGVKKVMKDKSRGYFKGIVEADFSIIKGTTLKGSSPTYL